MRVHELAKKLKVTSKELIEELRASGIKVKNHMEMIDSEAAETFEKKWKAKAKPEPADEKKPKRSSKIVTQASEVLSVAAPKPQPQSPATLPPPPKPEAKPDAPVESKPVSTPSVVPPPVMDQKPPLPPTPPAPAAKPEPAEKLLRVDIPITVGALAEKLGVRVSELIKALIELGIFANVNQLLSQEVVSKVGHRFGVRIEKIEDEEEKNLFKTQEEDARHLKSRAPVVTLMGHVDHGKTSLLDAIRKTNVAGGEVGQITQHIGAYMVDIPGKGHVTFLDTPGHEAFTAMRARGANVTDVVVLVVAADDGVMPQTVEAIDHARAAGCPIVVAINKCDLPTAQPQKVMGELQKLDLVPEEWGGKTICSKVSARAGTGIEELLELLLLEAEILELKANPDRSAQGTVLEAKLTKGQGPVATVIVQSGTLRPGDLIVAGPYYGKVRALRNDRGKTVKEAEPSHAVEVLGLSGTPEAGEIFTAISDEKTARRIAEKRELEIRERAMKGLKQKHLSLEELHSGLKEGRIKELKLIIKADVQGSIEAIGRSLEQVVSEKIKVRILHGAVGGINESDIMLAAASDAVVIGFHVKVDERAQELAEKEGVDVRVYHIIYEVIEEVQKAMEGLLEPTMKEVIEGRTEVRKIFQSSKIGHIGGAFVLKGRLVRNQNIRVIRNNIVVHQGRLSSLKRFQDDAREVQEGYDCGLVVEGFSDLREGDIIESYRIEKVAAKLA